MGLIEPDQTCTTVTLEIRTANIPLCSMAIGQRVLTFRGQKLWNSLPDEFQSIANLEVLILTQKNKMAFFLEYFGKLSFRYLTL